MWSLVIPLYMLNIEDALWYVALVELFELYVTYLAEFYVLLDQNANLAKENASTLKPEQMWVFR